ncbi:hypothetical protein [Cupriavidus sp. D39]|nr:hypothetical protein [Cupriavidus sp. D39]MCY0854171.1 hypothetical protein [Cupriavidus sp. D39]
MCPFAKGLAAIELWLAVEPIDMRAGTERLLARVVQVFGAAHSHHARV